MALRRSGEDSCCIFLRNSKRALARGLDARSSGLRPEPSSRGRPSWPGPWSRPGERAAPGGSRPDRPLALTPSPRRSPGAGCRGPPGGGRLVGEASACGPGHPQAGLSAPSPQRGQPPSHGPPLGTRKPSERQASAPDPPPPPVFFLPPPPRPRPSHRHPDRSLASSPDMLFPLRSPPQPGASVLPATAVPMPAPPFLPGGVCARCQPACGSMGPAPPSAGQPQRGGSLPGRPLSLSPMPPGARTGLPRPGLLTLKTLALTPEGRPGTHICLHPPPFPHQVLGAGA